MSTYAGIVAVSSASSSTTQSCARRHEHAAERRRTARARRTARTRSRLSPAPASHSRNTAASSADDATRANWPIASTANMRRRRARPSPCRTTSASARPPRSADRAEPRRRALAAPERARRRTAPTMRGREHDDLGSYEERRSPCYPALVSASDQRLHGRVDEAQQAAPVHADDDGQRPRAARARRSRAAWRRACPRPSRDGSPSTTRSTIHSMYAAASSTPTAATTVIQCGTSGLFHAPSSERNSPTKPDSPGRPERGEGREREHAADAPAPATDEAGELARSRACACARRPCRR